MGGIIDNITTKLNELFDQNLAGIIGLATVIIGGLVIGAGMADKPEWRKRAGSVFWGLLFGTFIVKAALPLITAIVNAVGGGTG